MADKDNTTLKFGRVDRQRNEDREVDFRVILYDLVHNWWIIALCALIAALGSYVVISELQSQEYTAEATFVVTSKDGGADQVYSNLVVASRLAA